MLDWDACGTLTYRYALDGQRLEWRDRDAPPAEKSRLCEGNVTVTVEDARGDIPEMNTSCRGRWAQACINIANHQKVCPRG